METITDHTGIGKALSSSLSDLGSENQGNTEILDLKRSILQYSDARNIYGSNTQFSEA
jgi:hypothetical protein